MLLINIFVDLDLLVINKENNDAESYAIYCNVFILVDLLTANE